MGAADDAHDQAGLLGVVLEGDHDASSLLQRLVFCLVDLPGHRRQDNQLLPVYWDPLLTPGRRRQPGV